MADTALEERIVWKLNLRLLPLLFMVVLASSLDRSNLSFAAKDIMRDLTFTKKQYGFGAGVYYCGFSLFLIPSSFLAVSVGPSRWLGFACCLWGLGSALLSTLTRSAMHFYVLRMLLGIAESGGTSVIYCLSCFYPSSHLCFAFALVHLSVPLSHVLGGIMAAAIMGGLDGRAGLAGWQWLFLMEGAPSVLLGIIVMAAIPNSIQYANFLTASEKEYWQRVLRDAIWKPPLAKGSSTRSHGASSVEESRCGVQGSGAAYMQCSCDSVEHMDGSGVVRAALLNWRVYYFGVVLLLLDCAVVGMHFWLPLLVDQLVGCQPQPGVPAVTGWWCKYGYMLLTVIPYAMAALSSLANARHARDTTEHRWHCAVPMLCAALCFVLLPVLYSYSYDWPAFVVLTVASASSFSIHGPLLSWPTSFLTGPAASTGLAVIKLMGGLGSFLGPAILGAVLQKNPKEVDPKQDVRRFGEAMSIMATAMAAAGLLVLAFRLPGGAAFVPISSVLEAAPVEAAAAVATASRGDMEDRPNGSTTSQGPSEDIRIPLLS